MMNKILTYLFLRKRVLLLSLITLFGVLTLIMQSVVVYYVVHLNTRVRAIEQSLTHTKETQNFRTQHTSPYGTRSEIRSVFKDGVWQTETNATPITEEEARAAEESWKKRHETLRAYWNEQERLFQDMRKQFFW